MDILTQPLRQVGDAGKRPHLPPSSLQMSTDSADQLQARDSQMAPEVAIPFHAFDLGISGGGCVNSEINFDINSDVNSDSALLRKVLKLTKTQDKTQEETHGLKILDRGPQCPG